MKQTTYYSSIHTAFTSPTLAVLAAIGLPLASVEADTLTYSTTQPAFDANDITQLATGTLAKPRDDNADYLAQNRPARFSPLRSPRPA